MKAQSAKPANTSAASLQASWQQLQTRFDALAQREKIIVSLVCLALVFMLVQLLLLDPLLATRKKTQGALQQSTQDLNALQLDVQTLNQAIVAGPKRQKTQQLDAMKHQAATLDQQIAKTTAAMIPPRMMTDVLREVLALRSDLKLIALENLAPEPLLTDDDLKAAGVLPAAENAKTSAQVQQMTLPTKTMPLQHASVGGAEDSVGLYRHGVTLVFEGDYMATLQFLQTLENKPWRFFWQQLQYSVENYPKARVTLTLYTLSPERAWLGV